MIATNILPYFDDQQLALAASNIAAMLAPGGVFLHNEARPILGRAHRGARAAVRAVAARRHRDRQRRAGAALRQRLPARPQPVSPPTPLAELARLFLRLGATSFGGPAAHIAMMQDEVVRKRGWMSATAFLDALSATNLIPGPNSTELAMHVGHQRAGARGLIVAGVCFIVPAALIVGVLAAGLRALRVGSGCRAHLPRHQAGGDRDRRGCGLVARANDDHHDEDGGGRRRRAGDAGLPAFTSWSCSPSAARSPWPSRRARRERSACLPPPPWREPRRPRQRRSASA